MASRVPIPILLFLVSVSAQAQETLVSRAPLSQAQRRACYAIERTNRVVERSQAVSANEKARARFNREHPVSAKLMAYTPAGWTLVRPKRWKNYNKQKQALEMQLARVDHKTELTHAEWLRVEEDIRVIEQQVELTERAWHLIDEPSPLGEAPQYIEGECLPDSAPIMSSSQLAVLRLEEWVDGIAASPIDQQLADSSCREIFAQMATLSQEPKKETERESKTSDASADSALLRAVRFVQPPANRGKPDAKEEFARASDNAASVKTTQRLAQVPVTQALRLPSLPKLIPMPASPLKVQEAETQKKIEQEFEQREKERAEEKEKLKSPGPPLPSKKEVLQKAQEFVDQWRKDDRSLYGSPATAELFLASEMYLSNEWTEQSQSAFPLMKAQWDRALSGIKKKHSQSIDIETTRNETVNAFLGTYAREKALIANAISEQSANCDGQTKTILAAVSELKPVLPPSSRVGYQLWADHVAPVVFIPGDLKTGKKPRVWDLQTNSELDAVLAPVYDTAGFINSLARELGGHSRPEDDFLLADADPVAVLQVLSPELARLAAPIAVNLSSGETAQFYTQLAKWVRRKGALDQLLSAIEVQATDSSGSPALSLAYSELAKTLRLTDTKALEATLKRYMKQSVITTNSVSGLTGRAAIDKFPPDVEIPLRSTMGESKKTQTTTSQFAEARNSLGLGSPLGLKSEPEKFSTRRVLSDKIVYGMTASRESFLKKDPSLRPIEALVVTDETIAGPDVIHRVRVAQPQATQDGAWRVSAGVDSNEDILSLSTTSERPDAPVNLYRAFFSGPLGYDPNNYYRVGPRSEKAAYRATPNSVPFRFVIRQDRAGYSKLALSLGVSRSGEDLAFRYSKLKGEQARIEFLRKEAIGAIRDLDALRRENWGLQFVAQPEKFKRLSREQRDQLQSWIENPPAPAAELIDVTRQLETLASLARVVTREEQDQFNPLVQVPEIERKIAENYAQNRLAKKIISSQPDRYLELSTQIPAKDRKLYAQWLGQVLGRAESDARWDPLVEDVKKTHAELMQADGVREQQQVGRRFGGVQPPPPLLGEEAWRALLVRATDSNRYRVEPKPKKGRAGPKTQPLEWENAPQSKQPSLIEGELRGDRKFVEKERPAPRTLSRELAMTLLTGPFERLSPLEFGSRGVPTLKVPDPSPLLTPSLLDEMTRAETSYAERLKSLEKAPSLENVVRDGPDVFDYRYRIPEPDLFARPIAYNLFLKSTSATVGNDSGRRVLDPQGNLIGIEMAQYMIAQWSANQAWQEVFARLEAQNPSADQRRYTLADSLIMALPAAEGAALQSDAVLRRAFLAKRVQELNQGRPAALRLPENYFDQTVAEYMAKMAAQLKKSPVR